MSGDGGDPAQMSWSVPTTANCLLQFLLKQSQSAMLSEYADPKSNWN